MTKAAKRSVAMANEAQAIWMRRLILFIAMIMSGGHIFVPREPLLALILLLGIFVANPTNFVRPELGRIWGFLILVLTVSMIGAGGIPLLDTAIRFANVIAGLLILVIYIEKPKSQLMDDAKPILIFFAFQSMLTPVLAALLPSFFIPYNFEAGTYFIFAGLFIYHQAGVGLLGLQRPDAFFFEPGVLQIYLNLLLYIALFQRRSLVLIGIALAGVAATQSTTGMIIATMLCGFAALSWVLKSQAAVGFAAIATLPFAVGPIIYLTYVNVIEKLFGDSRFSAAARSFDTETGLLIVQNHPLFGIGFSQDRFAEEFRRYGRTIESVLGEAALDRTMSNGLVHVMVVLGIPIFLVFVYAIFRQRLIGHSILVSAVILLSMTTEALMLTPFFLAIAFSGLLTPNRHTATNPKIGIPRKRRRVAA